VGRTVATLRVTTHRTVNCVNERIVSFHPCCRFAVELVLKRGWRPWRLWRPRSLVLVLLIPYSYDSKGLYSVTCRSAAQILRYRITFSDSSAS